MLFFIKLTNRRWAMIVAALLMLAMPGLADNSLDVINQRIKALEQEAAQTTDLNRLMQIVDELNELASQISSTPIPGGLPPVRTGRGRTPDEQINIEIDAINSSYERQKITFKDYRDPNAPLVPFLSARKLHGSNEVNGSNQRLPSETPYNGGVLRTLSYTIKEDFVGYLVTTEYYNPKTGKFIDRKDYALKSISTRVHPPAFSGKECVETLGNNWKICQRWEQYGLYEIAELNNYQSIHEWAVGGSADNDGIMIRVETPSIVFRTTKKNRSRSQGCFGADIFVDNAAFEADIIDNKVSLQQVVGRDFGGTPHCGKGSTVRMNLELCKTKPHCEQLEALLDNVLWAIDLRDKFLANSTIASSEEQLVQLVNVDLAARYPGLDITDKEYLKQNAGGYNFYTGKITLPNLCRGCATRPLCRWDMAALQAHENIHQLDVLADPVLKKIYTDSQFQLANYTANELAKEQARIRGEMEHHAYDEQARYLMDILDAELSNSACNFPASFYLKHNKAKKALK